jgi:cytochrome c peroxidase
MNRSRPLFLLPAFICLLTLHALAVEKPAPPLDVLRASETPAMKRHLNQQDIKAGRVTLDELIAFGRTLFEAKFNRLDGQGRPASTGTGAPRSPVQPAFVRTSAPDSNSCSGCHSQPRTGGAGDFVADVFVLEQARDPVSFSVDAGEGNERNTLGMFGAGPIELVAREMTRDLIAIRESALAMAKATGAPSTQSLTTKGISFGSITALPDGRVDPTGIAGVDWDLIVKPFHQKGAVVSLREFSNTAMNHHHGMQSVERFGAGTDPDLDGVRDELTVGDITALTVFQAALDTPGQVLPKDPGQRAEVREGEQVFGTIACTTCHVPALVLDDPKFTEPNPYNPAGNLRPDNYTGRAFELDLTRQGIGRRLERLPDGHALVRAYTDLKRHDLTDAEYTHFANEQIAQGDLAGLAPASGFAVIPPTPRPKRAFLTRKLWDLGSSAPYGHRGDLTTVTEAIYFHGGEARASRDRFFALLEKDRAAVVSFLKSLQVLSE